MPLLHAKHATTPANHVHHQPSVIAVTLHSRGSSLVPPLFVYALIDTMILDRRDVSLAMPLASDAMVQEQLTVYHAVLLHLECSVEQPVSA